MNNSLQKHLHIYAKSLEREIAFEYGRDRNKLLYINGSVDRTKVEVNLLKDIITSMISAARQLDELTKELDQKDARIESLLEDLDDSETQYNNLRVDFINQTQFLQKAEIALTENEDLKNNIINVYNMVNKIYRSLDIDCDDLPF